ncbi:hypothetical protein GCM10025857_23400 [Alicyclobacillus contaminans]|uniref:lipase family protein n=1 Tax=Alicyclobacillus contaminans TaxID=392016 RepID=UPI0003F5359A|nr:lipase family protein [Alicyclobacillus contaminans]GMA50983.1 hypothetical protein GCM10025857_23400 [Alicyclobacillus contaminans]
MPQHLDVDWARHWGRFIQTVESMYTPGVTNPPPATFPADWRVVCNITSAAGLPGLTRREFIGVVLQSQLDAAQYAVVLHGSESLLDFIDDFEFALTEFPLAPGSGKTEFGFTRFYDSFWFVEPETGAVRTLPEYLAALPDEARFVVTGHSLGGALATLHALVLAQRGIPARLLTFGSPMVGDAAFAHAVDTRVPDSWRIVNVPDVIPRLPGHFLGYSHTTSVYEINSLEVPHTKRCLGCFHDLKTYLYTLGDHSIKLGRCGT